MDSKEAEFGLYLTSGSWISCETTINGWGPEAQSDRISVHVRVRACIISEGVVHVSRLAFYGA